MSVARSVAPAPKQQADRFPARPAIATSVVPHQMLQRKCACGGGCSSCQGKPENEHPIQRKLRINEPGDQFERDADRVADRVVAMPEGGALHETAGLAAPSHLQRKCACGGSCASCKGDEEIAQRKERPTSAGPTAAALHPRDLGPGLPLDSATRAYMEPRFGADFSHVRIHTGPRAAAAARSIDALAYTLGTDVVFAGQYSPDTPGGKHLLAHELTHVLQQRGPAVPAIQRKRIPNTVDPCANWSSQDLVEQLPAYNHQEDVFGSPGLHGLAAVLGASLPVLERARMLRVACCQLEPADAAQVKDAFAKRRAKAGQVFHELHPSTQRDLMTILDDRASRGGKAEGAQVGQEIERQFEQQERTRHRALERQKRDEEQWAHDKELFNKAGRTTWFDVVFPNMAGVYRIPYADQIHDPTRKFYAQTNERGARVSIAGAIADPITRPVKAVIQFFECLIGAIKSGDVKALTGRFGLKFAAAFTASFGPGVIVGATKEIGSIAKQIVSIIRHPVKFVEDLWEFLKLMWSPNSEEIACAMGEDMGSGASKQIGELAKAGDIELSYGLGKIAGPFLLNTLLALVAPEIVGGLKATRIGKRLLRLLESMGDELKFLNKWRRRGKKAVEVEKDVVKAERVEEAIADAGKYMAEHKVGTVEEAADGLRHAPLGNEGHEVVEVLDKTAPTGIACEIHSRGPHPRVPCPPKMGSRKETLEEFKARGGKVEEGKPGPVPEITESEKVVPSQIQPPAEFDAMPNPYAKTAKRAVGIPEAHHIATKYSKRIRAIFKRLKMFINKEGNLILEFEEHGRLRGWYDWEHGGRYYMKGHHPEYHNWVAQLLEEAAAGVELEEGQRRVGKVLDVLRELVRENPELLSHGPNISPKFKNLKIPFD